MLLFGIRLFNMVAKVIVGKIGWKLIMKIFSTFEVDCSHSLAIEKVVMEIVFPSKHCQCHLFIVMNFLFC